MPRLKTAAVVVAAATAFGLTTSTPASADTGDYAVGALVDSTDAENAAVAAAEANASSPDVTCANPTAAGLVITPDVNAHPLGTIDGNDIGNGTGQCLTLQGSFFSATLVTQVEYLPNGAFSYEPIPGCAASSTATSNFGVATPVAPTVSCNYPTTAAWAFQPHRIHSILTNTLTTNVYDGYSPVYNSLGALNNPAT